jgi:hypothetical protein
MYLRTFAEGEYTPGPELRDLVQVERQPTPNDEVRDAYNRLKESPFYVPEAGIWLPALPTDNNRHSTTSIAPATKILTSLIESRWDEFSARAQFDQLKDSPFYNKEKQRWVSAHLADGKLTNSNAYPELVASQLWGIIGLAHFNKIDAASVFAALEAEPRFTRSYAKDRGRVWRKMTSDRHGKAKFVQTQEQLLAVLAMSLCDQPRGGQAYQTLRDNSPFYNHRWNQWSANPDHRWEFKTSDQLLDICIQLVLGSPTAKEQYENLKVSQFFDKNKQLWGEWKHDRVKPNGYDINTSHDQLLGLWIESQLAKPHQESTQLAMPDVVKFEGLRD